MSISEAEDARRMNTGIGAMKRQLALLSVCLNLMGCAGSGQQARPVFSLNNEAARTVLTDPYHQGKEDFATRQYGHAIEQFRIALRRDPYNIDALNALGITYGRLGRNKIARRYLERALSLDPLSPATLNNLGWSWMDDQNWEMAIRYLKQARSLDGNDQRIAMNLQAASVKAAAVLARSSEVAHHPASEPRIERTSPSVQVLHTKPEPSFSEGGGIADQQAAMGASPTSSISLAPVYDAGLFNSAGSPSAGRAAAAPVALALVNGTGRRGMAARFRNHLAGQGIYASSLANAVRYTHRTTMIFYRGSREHQAAHLAAALPLAVRMVRSEDSGPDLRLRLGSDLLHFDERMLATIRETKGTRS